VVVTISIAHRAAAFWRGQPPNPRPVIEVAGCRSGIPHAVAPICPRGRGGGFAGLL